MSKSSIPANAPAWYEGETPPRSLRSLFKWGDPARFKHPNRGLYAMMKEIFGMSDADFVQPLGLGLEDLDCDMPVGLDAAHVRALCSMVGEENVSTDTYLRTHVSYGCGMIDILRLRKHLLQHLPDAVVAPRSAEDVQAVVAYCHQNNIPLYIYGAGSTVTRGTEAVRGGVTLDMSRHMNKVLSFSAENQTITVQPGMTGPQLEEILNNAPQTLGAPMRYTLGHFPQSFEYSSVGGWVVTRGAGQNSTYYGKIEDMVLGQEYVTPVGVLRTPDYPRSATGPDMDQIMIGSEGCFGVLTAVTLKLSRYMPENTRRFSFMFRTWDQARAACREIMQGEFGFPSVFRLSDPEETDIAMRMYHIHGTPADTVLRVLDYQPMQRCLMLGSADGSASYTRQVTAQITRICARHGAFVLSPFGVTKRWEKSRFTDPYMREDLQDFGILTDTLECAVTWEQMGAVHESVRAVVKARPNTICMTHLSHAYPQGANLYFIFIARMDSIQEYLHLQYSILEAIRRSGAAMSHHHGIGKQTAPWLEEQIGTPAMQVIRTLKEHFDPRNVMNPGGTLGLDMDDTQRAKQWSMDI